MLKILKHTAGLTHENQGVQYLLIEKWYENLGHDLAHCDAVILQSDNEQWCKETIVSLKLNASHDSYLLPIFCRHQIPDHIMRHTDGLFSEHSSSEVKSIQARIKKLEKGIISGDYEKEIMQKLLRYLYTREGSLDPFKYRSSHLGVGYPFLGFFYEQDGLGMLSVLERLKSQGHLKGKLLNRLQLCKNCSDSYLWFKETCPKCDSLDIVSEDIVHHFPCAHVAPLSKFKRDGTDDLNCPKCDKGLRHIGIDYDKPSVMHHCNGCGHDFQEGAMKAECHGCGTLNPLDELKEAELHSFSLTAKGMICAENGMEEEKPLVSQPILFKELWEQEKSRSLKAGRESIHILVGLQGKLLKALDPLFLSRLWTEIAHLANTYVTSEHHILNGEDHIQLLLLDFEKTELASTLEKLERNLNMLLVDNIGPQLQIYLQKQKIVTG